VAKNPEYDFMPDTPRTIAEINQPIAEYLYQSDILLTNKQLNQLISNARKKRKAISDPSLKWPTKAQGVIPYTLDESLSTFNRRICHEINTSFGSYLQLFYLH
jgi:hypothetical protein